MTRMINQLVKETRKQTDLTTSLVTENFRGKRLTMTTIQCPRPSRPTRPFPFPSAIIPATAHIAGQGRRQTQAVRLLLDWQRGCWLIGGNLSACCLLPTCILFIRLRFVEREGGRSEWNTVFFKENTQVRLPEPQQTAFTRRSEKTQSRERERPSICSPSVQCWCLVVGEDCIHQTNCFSYAFLN